MTEALDTYQQQWNRKPVLRTVYNDIYDRITALCTPGVTIEIGGGIGKLKHRLPRVITTDIQFGSWLDCLADAQRLPFAATSAANIVMVDVLHHLEFPVLFFREAERILKPGGRVIMVEPAITWGSTLFYRLFHGEPVRTSADPLIEGSPNPHRDPYHANQAIPTLLATRDRNRFERRLPDLRVVRVDWFALAVYPLSGGFKSWALISDALARRVLKFERAIEPLLGHLTGFRMLMVVEKASNLER